MNLTKNINKIKTHLFKPWLSCFKAWNHFLENSDYCKDIKIQ